MSRIGKKPIVLPKGVTFAADGSVVRVKGPKGELSRAQVAGVTFNVAGDQLVVEAADTNRAAHGLMRALVANMVTGVSTGFEKKLEIVGVGYKAEVKGTSLVMSLGFSHQVVYPFPAGITIGVDGTTKLVVRGSDRERVGQVASELREFRSPDSYKGKGVRYAGEHIRIKAGKSGQK